MNKQRATGQASVDLHPAAKVNLSLVVFGVRADGFHDLHTVMATVNLCDDLTLELTKGTGIELECVGLASPSGTENLVYRAAELFFQATSQSPGVSIRLMKRIPAGAGLGGASSDAAACLAGMNTLTGARLSRTELSELAGQLGSDVPFFLFGPTAICTGRGEIVEPLKMRCKRSILLVLTGIEMSTAEVYRQYRHEPSKSQAAMMDVQRLLGECDLDTLGGMGINSLTDTTMRSSPELAKLRKRIENMGIGPVHMSGSGSSLFVVGSAEDTAEWHRELTDNDIADSRVLTFQDQQDIFPEVHHERDGGKNKAG